MIERRQIPRWEIKKDAKVWMSQLQGIKQCFVEDMHLTGMRVSFNRRLPHQEIVRMSVAIGDNFDFIKLEAHISWVREDQGRFVYGLTFSKINAEDKDRIYQYITTNCYEQFKSNRWAV